MSDKFELTPFRNYDLFLQDVKERIHRARIKTALAVNQELVLLYWEIGKAIIDRQQSEGWGAKVLDRLAEDLKQSFPEMKGFSKTNLKYMRSFAQTYPELEQISQQAVDQIPWGHIVRLTATVKDPEERHWYIKQTIENGWSRQLLEKQINSGLYTRQGGAITNFERTLPKPQSDLANEILKDPYHFDFLNLTDPQERELEHALVVHIRDFLLELGLGFAFLGSQYPVVVSGKEYRIDLLFYHIELRCFIVIELKTTEFIPEYTGKMNFYISAIDDLLRKPQDNPTIGIILCKSKDKTTAEYALRNIHTPIGVSTHQIPEPIKELMPTIEQLEVELQTIDLPEEQ